MEKLRQAVEKHAELILNTERYIWQNPETGYKEIKTSAYMQKIFEDLGYELNLAGDIPGFYTIFDTGKKGPTLLIMAELDSVICPEHPECDKQTGAVHACGHNAQCAALAGIAAALKEPGVIDGLCGRIMLCAVPAEELIEMDYRIGLKDNGIIQFFGGKQEFMARGYFDDVDLAFMVHTTAGENYLRYGGVGLIAKQINYKGIPAHAGGSPWNGKNALYAAMNGLNAANALRETFHEDDLIRFHPILTNGGVMVNAIPGETSIESYVRGASYQAIIRENKKINQALIGAALSMDTNIEINDYPGYAPHKNDVNMMALAKEAANKILPESEFLVIDSLWPASTDMGDISMVMPSVHPYAGGAVGVAHGCDYYIENPQKACVDSAKMQMAMLKLLLEDDAKKANEIIADFKPEFTIPEYIKFMESLYRSGERIEYKDDNEAIIKL